MIQHTTPLAQKAAFGPAQTSSRRIPGRGGKVARLSWYEEKGCPCGCLQVMGKVSKNTKMKPISEIPEMDPTQPILPENKIWGFS